MISAGTVKYKFVNNKIVIITVLLIAFLLVAFSHNRYTGSDPRATLLVSDSILTHHTIKLDHYGDKFLQQYGYAVYKKNGHYYYYFPIGTPIASLPVIALAKGFGFNIAQSEYALQMVIAAVTSVLTLFFLIQLAQLFLEPMNSLVVASIFWFGSSLVSTCGTALWSHNFATLFALIAIYYSVKLTKYDQLQFWPIISICLFAAYLCRPTMALLSPFVLLYLFTYYKRVSLLATILEVILFVTFVVFSIYEFNQVLPDYYLPQRLEGGRFFEAFYGNLLSPARGVLIYSPFIFTAWFCFWASKKNWDIKKSWLLIGIGWPLMHLIAISRFPHWWAGWSFGARFMTDVIPGIFLFTLYTWPTTVKGKINKLTISLLIISSVFAIYVNSVQGLFNKYTPMWNANPNIDEYPEYLFDWSCPQFLANKKNLENRMVLHAIRYLPVIKPSEMLDHKSKKIVFIGWSDAEPLHRWSEGKACSIFFKANTEIDKFEGQIIIQAATLGKQRVQILLNKKEIYSDELNLSSFGMTSVQFPLTLIKDGVNLLQFQLPDAHLPGNGDPRILALALKSISIM